MDLVGECRHDHCTLDVCMVVIAGFVAVDVVGKLHPSRWVCVAQGSLRCFVFHPHISPSCVCVTFFSVLHFNKFGKGFCKKVRSTLGTPSPPFFSLWIPCIPCHRRQSHALCFPFAQVGISPDGWIQMALQLAYYRCVCVWAACACLSAACACVCRCMCVCVCCICLYW